MRRTIPVAVVVAVVGAVAATPIAVYASHSFNDVPKAGLTMTDQRCRMGDGAEPTL